MNHNSTFSIHSKTIGISLFAGGILLIIGTYALDVNNNLLDMLFAGITLIGAAIFIIGMIKTAMSLTQKVNSLHHDDGAIAAMALMRCMIAICIADNHLDEREVQMIAKIYKQLMHIEIDKEAIINAAEEMQQTETNITAELTNINDILYDDLRMKILKASLYILVADSDVDEREEATLEKIRQGLGYSKRKLEKAKKTFLTERNLL